MKILDRFKAVWDKRQVAKAVKKTLANADTALATRKEKKKKDRPAAYALMPGASWNPLTKWPRNHVCFCGSMRKSKNCCLPHVARALPTVEAEALRAIWAKLASGELKLEPAPKSPAARKAIAA